MSDPIQLLTVNAVAGFAVHQHVFQAGLVLPANVLWQDCIISFDWGDSSDVKYGRRVGIGLVNDAKVYADPATYTLRFTAIHLKSPWSISAWRYVHVAPFVAKPLWVDAANGTDANGGLSYDKPLKTVDRAAALMKSGAGNEILLRRVSDARYWLGWTINPKGANLKIGAWGEGTFRPVLQCSVDSPFGSMIHPDPTSNGIAIEDIAFDVSGKWIDGKTNISAIFANGVNNSVRRCDFRNIYSAVDNSSKPIKVLIEDSLVTDPTFMRGYFNWLKNCDTVIRGNTVANSVGQHDVRSSSADTQRLAMYGNKLSNPSWTVANDVKGSVVNLRVCANAYIGFNTFYGGPVAFGPSPSEDAEAIATGISSERNELTNGGMEIYPNTRIFRSRGDKIAQTGRHPALSFMANDPDPKFVNRKFVDVQVEGMTMSNAGGPLVVAFNPIGCTIDGKPVAATS